MSELSPRTLELLEILQEEAAEVIQAVSKIKRFGIRSYHPDDPAKTCNLAHLAVEIGDFVGMVDLLTQGELKEYGFSWDGRGDLVSNQIEGIDSIARNSFLKKEKVKKFLRT